MLKLISYLKYLPVLAIAVALFATPLLGFAQWGDLGPAGGQPPIEDVSDFVRWLETLLTYLQMIFWILAVAFLIIAAIYYLTAAGSEERLKKAKSMLIYAVIAIVIALFATGAGTLIESILTQT